MNKYKKIKLKNGGTRDEHRIVMEDIIGRRLAFNEVVHHKDGDKSNNNLSNLCVMSRAEHVILHIKNGDIVIGNRIPTESEKICLCNRFSNVTESVAKRIKYNNESPSLLINELEISKFVISRIRRGVSWKHI